MQLSRKNIEWSTAENCPLRWKGYRSEFGKARKSESLAWRGCQILNYAVSAPNRIEEGLVYQFYGKYALNMDLSSLMRMI